MAEIQTYLYGKKFPNRIFVGGLPLNTNAVELAKFFNFFGHVTESKIILDDSGLSKGYGFVTFEDKSSVRKVESMGIIYFKNKKINIGPAVRKEATVVQPELVMWPANAAVGHQNVVQPQFYGYQQQPQQSQYPMQPFYTADCYGYLGVANDGVYWLTYPWGNCSHIQQAPKTPTPPPQPREYRKRKDVPPRFMKRV